MVDSKEPSVDVDGMQAVLRASISPNRKLFGSSGTELYAGYFSEEYLGQLRGRLAAEEFDKIRRSESQVSMLMGAIQNPIKSANWSVQAYKEAPRYQAQADLIEHILLKNLPNGWAQFIHEALGFIPFGHSVFEVVHSVEASHPRFGMYNGLATLAWRSQKTIERWNLDKKTGRLLNVEQYADGDLGKTVKIPGEFLLVFTNQREGDNYEGISALRPMYGAYKRKELLLKLAAVGVEKYAFGTPKGTVPPGKEKSPEFEMFKNVLNSYVLNETAFILTPTGWDIEIIKGDFDAQKIVELLRFENTEMINSLVANFLALGTGGNGGAFALGQDLSDFFLGGIQSYANIVCDTINRYLIPSLVKLNFGEQEGYPELNCTGINDKAGKELSDIVVALAGSKVIKADDKLDEFMRKAYKLPKGDPATAREAEKPAFNPGMQFSEKAETIQFAAREDSKRYREELEDNKQAVKSAIKENLQLVLAGFIDELRRNWKKSNDTNFVKAAGDLSPKGMAAYREALKEFYTVTAAGALKQARKEVPSKKDIKLFESVEALKFGEFEKLPAKVRALIEAATLNVSEATVADLKKIVVFQYSNSAASTENFEIIAKDIIQKAEAMIDGSTASGASIDAAAGNSVAQITQETRKFFFFEPEVLDEVESFTFVNEDPVSPICQDLNGITFLATDPEAERYMPPLHHNCKSRVMPNLKGTKGNPDISENGLKPSRASLEKYITLHEHICGGKNV